MELLQTPSLRRSEILGDWEGVLGIDTVVGALLGQRPERLVAIKGGRREKSSKPERRRDSEDVIISRLPLV